MESTVRSLLEMAHGAILERADYETARVMENIMDPNTEATAKRKITLTLEFKPDANRQMISVNVVAKSNLAPTSPIALSLLTGIENGRMTAVEMSNNIPGQTSFAGSEEPDRAVLRFPGEVV